MRGRFEVISDQHSKCDVCWEDVHAFGFTRSLSDNGVYICIPCGSLGKYYKNWKLLIPLSLDQYINLGFELDINDWTDFRTMQHVIWKFNLRGRKYNSFKEYSLSLLT